MYLGKSEINSVVTLPVLLYKYYHCVEYFWYHWMPNWLSFYVYDRLVIIYNLQHIEILVLGPER